MKRFSSFGKRSSFFRTPSRSYLNLTRDSGVQILYSQSVDPIFNLATEEYLFDHVDIKVPTLFLWRNDKTIVIGNHQNAWKECHTEAMKEDGITLARRKSGGGAVYQDLGNLIFTFINPTKGFEDKELTATNMTILTNALKTLDFDAAVSGRNDIAVGEKKVSGSAFKRNPIGKRFLHHGTMLYNVDMGALQRYLNPSKKKLESKGVDSVRARVLNLIEGNSALTYEGLQDAIIEAFIDNYKDQDVHHDKLKVKKLNEIEKVKDIYETTSSWEWRFGKSPKSTHYLEHRFPWGTLDIHFDVSKGKIINYRLFSDCLVGPFITRMNEVFNDAEKPVQFNEAGLKQAYDRLAAEFEANDLVQGFISDLRQLSLDQNDE